MNQAEFWLWQAAVALGLITLLAWAVTYLIRRSANIRMYVLLWCSAYVLSAVFAIGNGLMAYKLVMVEEQLKRCSSIRPISEDWGRELTNEKRSENSLALARSAYESTGDVSNYFDLNGRFILFAPTSIDRANRERQLTLPRIQAKFSALASALWLFIPLLTSGVAFRAFRGGNRNLGSDTN